MQNEVMTMPERRRHVSPRRSIARRIGAAGLALATLLTLGACKATGGGYIGLPVDGGAVGVFQGRADFGFTYTCEMNPRARTAVIRGQITYHDSPSTIAGATFPEIRLQGIVDPFFVPNVSSCQQAAEVFPDAAQFEGTYRSQDTRLSKLKGRFVVQVFDQGEPGSSRGEITGDGFAIELLGGAYGGYTRAGYIEGGNIQVR